MTRCLAPDCQMGGLGCDNMTVILVCLLCGQSYDDFCLKCSRPRRKGAAAKPMRRDAEERIALNSSIDSHDTVE